MPENTTDQERLNPRRRVQEIGTRQLREITLWPMAFGDQLKLKEIIVESAQEFFMTVLPQKLLEAQESGDDNILKDLTEVETMEYVKFFTTQIEKNIEAVLALAIDKEEDASKILMESDNFQISEIITIIFEANFGEVSKNVQSLIAKVKKTFQSMRQQPQSADGTGTGLTTSTSKDSKTEG